MPGLVLVTRADADAARTAAALQERGFEALIAPLTRIEPTGEPMPAGDFDVILAASAQAARHMTATPALLDLPVHAVGRKTQAAFREAGFTSAGLCEPDRLALTKSLQAALPAGTRCLAILGQDRHEDWLAALEASGHTVTGWTVYRAAACEALEPAARDALASGQVAAVLHYSARQAGLFISLAGELARNTRHFALSEAVAAPLRAIGLDPIVASGPEEAQLLDALGGARLALPAEARIGQGTSRLDRTDQAGTGAMAKKSDKARAQDEPREAQPDPAGETPMMAETAAPHAPGSAPATADAPADPTPEPAAVVQPTLEEQATPPAEVVAPIVTRIIERRTSPVMLAVAALLGGGIAAFGMQFMPRMVAGTPPRPDSGISAVEARIAALEAAQGTAARAATDTKVALDAAASRIDALAKAAPAAPSGPVALPPEWAERLARLEAAEANASRQRGETGDAVRRESQALTQRLAATEEALKAQQGPSPAAQAALRLSLLDRIRGALATGQAFAPELAALQKDGLSAEALRPLAALAQGAPTRAALAEEVRRQRKVLTEDTAATARGWSDRVLQMADSLVQVRRVDGPADQPTPAGLTLALEQALVAGDTAKASGLWNRLPEPARRATARLGADLAARAAAEAALAAMSAAELATLARR